MSCQHLSLLMRTDVCCHAYQFVALHSGRMLDFDWWTFPVPCLTWSWRVTTYVGKPSDIGQSARPTQFFIFPWSINCVLSYIGCMLPCLGGAIWWMLRSKVWMVVLMAGKICDLSNMCHSEVLCGCLVHMNVLCKYFILFYFTVR